jgi:hypothetical protein
MLRSNRIPKATIAGLNLTQDQARFFISATLALLPIISQQLQDIQQPNRHHPTLHRHLRIIQERQFRFQNKMSEVIKATKDSTETWVGELMDGHEAVLRKVRQCNRISDAQALGWKAAALQYWPMIADSYEMLQPNLERLLQEVDEALADKELWSTTTKSNLGRRLPCRWFGTGPQAQLGGKTVTFDKEVQARWISERDEPERVRAGRGVAMPLTNDRKQTVRKFKTKSERVVSGTWQEDEEDGEDMEELQEIPFQALCI